MLHYADFRAVKEELENEPLRLWEQPREPWLPVMPSYVLDYTNWCWHAESSESRLLNINPTGKQ